MVLLKNVENYLDFSYTTNIDVSYYFQKLEEMQRSTVRQKDASETEGESIQNSDQASNAIRGRNVGYNEETSKTD